jgi:hypothetical protein
MDAATALSWGLVDELAEDGRTVDAALAMARKTAEMPAATVRLMKEAINATAGALHRATSFADGDHVPLPVSWTREGDINIAPPPSIVDPDATERSRFIGHAAIAAIRAATGV